MLLSLFFFPSSFPPPLCRQARAGAQQTHLSRFLVWPGLVQQARENRLLGQDISQRAARLTFHSTTAVPSLTRDCCTAILAELISPRLVLVSHPRSSTTAVQKQRHCSTAQAGGLTTAHRRATRLTFSNVTFLLSLLVHPPREDGLFLVALRPIPETPTLFCRLRQLHLVIHPPIL